MVSFSDSDASYLFWSGILICFRIRHIDLDQCFFVPVGVERRFITVWLVPQHQLTKLCIPNCKICWALKERVGSLESPARRRGGPQQQPGDSDTSDLSPLADGWRTRQAIRFVSWLMTSRTPHDTVPYSEEVFKICLHKYCCLKSLIFKTNNLFVCLFFFFSLLSYYQLGA